MNELLWPEKYEKLMWAELEKLIMLPLSKHYSIEGYNYNGKYFRILHGGRITYRLYLSAYPSFWLSFCLSFYLSGCVCLFGCVFVCLSVCLPIWLLACLLFLFINVNIGLLFDWLIIHNVQFTFNAMWNCSIYC